MKNKEQAKKVRKAAHEDLKREFVSGNKPEKKPTKAYGKGRYGR